MTISQAIETAKAKAAGNARWTRAIERAEAGLAAGWVYTEHADGSLLVTTESLNTYTVREGSCNCKSDSVCKHRALRRILQLTEEVAPAAATSHESVIADLQAAWERKYPGNRRWSLGNALLGRFGTSDPNQIATGYLRQLLAAVLI